MKNDEKDKNQFHSWWMDNNKKCFPWCSSASSGKQSGARAVVVAQLVEHLLPPSDIRGSNPVIGKFYLLPAALKRYWKAKNKKKSLGKAQFKKHLWPMIQNF